MAGSFQTTLRQVTGLLAKLARQTWEFGQKVILPRADFCWRSLLDLIILINTSDNRGQLRRSTMTSLMRAERRLEAILPGSFKHDWPVKTVGLLLLLLLFAFLPSGDSSIDDLKEAGELVVISRESPTTLYQGSDGPAGPEYDYLKSFAEFLGVELRFEMRDNDQEVLSAITEDEGHVAAAGMTFYPPLEDKGFIFGPGYQDVDIQVVCRRNKGKRPRNVEELNDVELVVVADSTYEAILFELQEEYSDLNWESEEDANVDDLLQLVWRKEIDCTIANSSEVNIKRRFYPELQVAFTLEENQELAWNLSPEWEALAETIDQWLSAIENDGTLLVLKDRHYNSPEFDYVDMRTFIRRIKSRLPRLVSLFEKAAEKYGIPWTLLAAQAYQESHWNRRAKSPTGVRGIMMLTLTTAKEMGVKSRLDAAQSIMGGAKYLSRLEGRIPESVKGDDRWWYALTAYNIGMGHLRDALTLADDLDLNPDSWLELRGILPLLSQKKYYKKLKYGYARGTEPVTYVRQIRNYRNILRAQIISKRGAHAG
jgi:membrane-bound lytic murein transglycosylase F